MRVLFRSLVLCGAVSGVFAATPAQAQQECMLAEIKLFAGNFAPKNYALAQGQILSIAQNQALFALLGTTFGGDGQTTFALPDLRGRYPIGTGQGPGLSNRDLGEKGGEENVTLTTSQMPAHDHVLNGSNTLADHARPLGRTLGKVSPPTTFAYATAVPDAPMTTGSIGTSGGNLPHDNMSPYLGINYIICIQGIFPSRN